jgi:hypothetical protein
METSISNEIKKVARYSIILIIILSLFILAKTFGELKSYRFIGSGVSPHNVITVRGEGEVFSVPDVAEFSFSVIEEGKEVKGAQDKASEKLNRAISTLKDSGIEERDIKTTAYYINPKYEYQKSPCTRGFCPPGRQMIIGYEVSQTISVKVRETDKVGQIIQSIGSLEVSNLSDFRLTIDDEDALKAEARTLAIEDAKSKAEILSEDLDVKLVRLVTYSESEPFLPFREGFGGDVVVQMAEIKAAPEVPVGENRIVSEIYLTYEIESR